MDFKEKLIKMNNEMKENSEATKNSRNNKSLKEQYGGNTYEEIMDSIKRLDNYEMSDRDFIDFIDDLYGKIQLLGGEVTYSHGRALKELDPVVFRGAKYEQITNYKQEGKEQIKEDIQRNIEDEDQRQELLDALERVPEE